MGLQLVLLRTGLKPSLHDTALQLGGDVEQPWLMSKCDKAGSRHVSLPPQRRTESRPYVTCTEEFDKDRTCSSEDMTTDTQTDMLITILHSPIGGGLVKTTMCHL